MKSNLVVLALLGVTACSPEKGIPMGSASTTTASGDARGGFLPVGSVRLSWGDGGPVQPGALPVPVTRKGALCLAAFEISLPASLPFRPREENEKTAREVSIPMRVVYVDLRTGKLSDSTGPGYSLYNTGAAEHFGIPSPPDRVVGHFDDPQWPTKERRDLLRTRIFAAMDVLLPLFDNPSLPWTEQANLAAREIRDFFPVAAEPGLWPYYKAEGEEFFAWVEKNAPPGKVPLPWESAAP